MATKLKASLGTAATGTPSATTFLRGDNAWVAAGGANTPAFFAGTSTTNNTLSTLTTFAFNTETFDTDGCYDTTTYRFTPTTAGKYFLYTQTLPYNVGPSYQLTDRLISIYKNDTTPQARCSQLTSAGSTYAEEMNCSAIVEANGTTDFFNVKYEVYVASGTIQHDGGACNFFGFKILT
jgi:hypothetical protein